MAFELFDPNGDLSIREGHLPHWYQPGVTYFVTFRTDDSVPQSVSRGWHARRDVWLRRHGIESSREGWKAKLREDPELADEYYAKFTREFLAYLDRGCGECLLRDPRLADIVADSLRHFDGERYHLGDFVVMPNHVHLLVCLLGTAEIERQCRSWKKFIAGKINAATERHGQFWQEESFDHLVRSVEQFEYFQRYIADNPIKAGLLASECLYYARPK